MTTSSSLPVVLRPGIGRRIAIILGSLILGAIGAAIVLASLDKGVVDLLGAGILLLGIVLVAQSPVGLLSAFQSRLALDSGGFALRGTFKTRRYRWQDVDGVFRPRRVDTGQGVSVGMVAWNLVPGTKPISAWRKLTRTAPEASIPAMFGGLNAEQLAALMNRIRDDLPPNA
jgi:hypothetical protein